MKKLLLFLLPFIVFSASAQNKLQTPDEFLGYKLGAQFTYHYWLVEYFRYVAAKSKQVKLQQYGVTNEGRPLIAVFIASDENIGQLENIRQNNLAMVTGKSNAKKGLPIVWLSFNVHGNEPSSSEAAMQTLYDMVNPANSRTQAWLKNTLVVIDPCLNPDGRDRYVNFYNPVASRAANPDPQSREHAEPWPGGRVSHYYFDLNRDWAWQTQKETQQRLVLYNQWLPEVHVDFHEQGFNSPYYFAPAAEPFHQYITPWQRAFQTTIGKNNAKYFDEKGWLYFTKERFDLLYPSYGDTYPIYNGSIGMTYEQGGIRAGLAVINQDGDTLTLAERIAHHHSNALATVETTSANAQKVTDEFAKFFADSRSKPQGIYHAYVIKNTNAEQVNRLANLLAKNGIEYGYGASGGGFGFNYLSAKNERFSIDKNDLVISTYQPKSVLLNVLFEPRTLVTDSNTYDITAWALPYAYGLPAYASKQNLKPAATQPAYSFQQQNLPAKPYAYTAAWSSVSSVQFLSGLLKKGIKVRFAEKALTGQGKQYAPGSLLITRAANKGYENELDADVKKLADSLKVQLGALSTGFVDKGFDLGSDKTHIIKKPRILTVSGDGVSSQSLGEVWQFFEQQINYPITIVRNQDLSRINWNNYDVAIFPDGDYDFLSGEKMQGWIKDGGKLIVMENAAASLAGKKDFALKKKDEKKEEGTKKKDGQKEQYTVIKSYEAREREFLKYSIPGAIYKIDLDNTHPLGFGFPGYYFSLKLNDDIYPYLEGEGNWNVGTFKKNNYVAGFVGQKAKAKLKDGTVIGVQEMGKGSIVYLADDPLFRSFWESGKLLFSNAVFMVGN